MTAASQTWQRLVTQLRADRKKAAILGVLTLGMVVVYARWIFSSKGTPTEAIAAVAAAAAASPATPAAAVATSASPAAVPALTSESELVGVERMSRNLSRDLFDTDLSSAEPPPDVAARRAAAAASQPSWAVEWWRRIRSAAQQESQRVEASRLESEAELAALRLQGTILGPEPKAWINGRLVREGEAVGSFHLLRIFARHVTLEKSGCNVRLTMP